MLRHRSQSTNSSAGQGLRLAREAIDILGGTYGRVVNVIAGQGK